MKFEEAALLEHLAMTHYACQKGGVTSGSSVLICGAGASGIMTMQCAKSCGALNVTVTGRFFSKLSRHQWFVECLAHLGGLGLT